VGIAAGAQNNTTGPVTATFDDGTGTFRPLTGAASNTATVTVLAPDLTISKTHSGTLTQGQVGVVYTITVTNAGTVPTTGTVTVMDTLPAGLTATALSGTGWTCSTPPMLVCTRGDALGAGLSYPVIQLTVNVAINAPASVTNTAVVSGGGETNTANDSATDTASVAQLPGPPLSITPIVGAQVVAAGGTATYNFTVTSSSTQLGGINFACLQLPPLTTCKFTPPSVAAFSGTTQVTMTLTTTAPSVSALPYAPPRAPQAPRGWPAAYAALLALLAVIARSWQLRKERRGRVRLAFGLAALIVVFAFAGCNGSHTTTVGGGTPVGGYAVGVTATSTNAPVVQASTSVNLTVQ